MMDNLHNWSAKGIFDRDQRVDGNLDLIPFWKPFFFRVRSLLRDNPVNLPSSARFTLSKGILWPALASITSKACAIIGTKPLPFISFKLSPSSWVNWSLSSLEETNEKRNGYLYTD